MSESSTKVDGKPSTGGGGKDKQSPETTPESSGSGSHLANKSSYNPLPQLAPGAQAATGHILENSIPLSIFPIAADKLCICMCGLPGRGKTKIASRLARYLDFFHAIPVKVFSAADYRREFFPTFSNDDFLDGSNLEAMEARVKCLAKVMEDMSLFLSQHTNVIGILDSSSPTHARRALIVQELRKAGAKTLFIEVQNENSSDLADLYDEVGSSSPDYKGMDREEANRKFSKRVADFRSFFETVDAPNSIYQSTESKWSYLKCDHSQQHFVIHNAKGYYQLKVVHFIVNMRTTSHSFFLTRHGQSVYNAVGKIGGDSGLSVHGDNYAKKLSEFVDRNITHSPDGQDIPARLWTSTMVRTKETAKYIKQQKVNIERIEEDGSRLVYEWIQMRPLAWHHLDELFAGDCDGLTYEEIEEKFPDEFKRRQTDKLAYRYPRGESYLDVIARLEPMIIEMERHREPLLIISHQGILRVIYAFYKGLSRNDAPFVSIPLNTVVELTPAAVGAEERRHNIYNPSKALAPDGQDDPHNTHTTVHSHNQDPNSH